jgi:putative two-component system protein, hydrogenase maturation factor HypX/HoxX
MRILLISSSYNGLCQRAHIELDNLGHEISVTLALSADDVTRAVALFQPNLLICPFLKEKIPEDVFKNHLCIILHPGITGDRGPSSLDWAIMHGETEWGSTALQAAEEMDAGDISATHNFPMRQASKASLYRREVTQAAIRCMLETVCRVESCDFTPEPLDYAKP